ncbi:hypothetical protein CP083_04205 [Candidatus Bathyarchaeota archaeon B24-2]|nr:MAG: hypothetical protein CP083_04205 [Candidatus Bathyarchaeota archaeon B24-2]
MVRVVMYGIFRKISGVEELKLNLKGRSVGLKDLLEKLRTHLPELIDALIDPELKDPSPNALILVNGREINVLNGLRTLIHDKDEVTLIPVLHGG